MEEVVFTNKQNDQKEKWKQGKWLIDTADAQVKDGGGSN